MVDEQCDRCGKVTETEIISHGMLMYRRCAKCGKPRSYQPKTNKEWSEWQKKLKR